MSAGLQKYGGALADEVINGRYPSTFSTPVVALCKIRQNLCDTSGLHRAASEG
jgi:hypothetical protein